ncbi:MAG: PorV/PorQ family protein [Elusimicrobiaceae bacterium]|nr:PorV/PorQ family protein [Elusimicrobiaceae bacterium]
MKYNPNITAAGPTQRIPKTLGAVLCALVFSCGAAFAAGEGTSAAQFLKIGAGSKPGAMADAYTALADDVYALYYNPAGMARMARPQFAGQLTNYFQDSDYGFLGFAYPFRDGSGETRHSIGVSIYSLKVNSLERRTQDTDNSAGLFDASDMAYSLSYACRVSRGLGLGASAKYIRGQIDDVKASAFAMDFGAQYVFERLSLGVTVRNAGSKMKYGSEADFLPLGVFFGLGYRAGDALALALETYKYRDYKLCGAFGADYTQELVRSALWGSLRAGYTTHNTDSDGFNGATFGAGLKYSKTAFDFAWVPFGDLGNTFRYTLSVQF